MNHIRVEVLVFFSVAHMLAIVWTGEAVQGVTLSSNDTVASLATTLTRGSLDARLLSICKLGLISNEASQAALVTRFQSIAQAEPATDSHQLEKTAIIKVLSCQLPQSRFQQFGLTALDEEVDALRAANKFQQENYYPKDLIYAILDLVYASDPTSATTLKALSSYATQGDIPPNVRSRIKSLLIDHQFRQDRVANASDKAQAIITVIEPGPTLSTPWNVYRDKNKRIAFGKTPEVKRSRKVVADWLNSEAAVENAAHEQVLNDIGMVSVLQLLDAVEGGHSTEEKHGYLVFLASSVLRKNIELGGTLTDQDHKQISRLRHCIEGLEDKGAFSRRARAAANLNAIYLQLGVDTRLNILPPELMQIQP